VLEAAVIMKTWRVAAGSRSLTESYRKTASQMRRNGVWKHIQLSDHWYIRMLPLVIAPEASNTGIPKLELKVRRVCTIDRRPAHFQKFIHMAQVHLITPVIWIYTLLTLGLRQSICSAQSTLYLVHIHVHVQEKMHESATYLNTSAGFPKFPRMSSGAMYFASPSIASLDFSSRETHRPKSPSLQVTPSPPMKMLAGLMSKWHNRLSWRCFRPCGRGIQTYAWSVSWIKHHHRHHL